MYNSYLKNDFYYDSLPETANDVQNENSSNKSIFSNMFDGFKMPEINTETIILLAVIYFCVYDDFDVDLLIIIGILFLLGI